MAKVGLAKVGFDQGKPHSYPQLRGLRYSVMDLGQDSPVDFALNVFFAVHVDDLIMVGSSSQLSEVVGEMKQ